MPEPLMGMNYPKMRARSWTERQRALEAGIKFTDVDLNRLGQPENWEAQVIKRAFYLGWRLGYEKCSDELMELM